MTPRQLKLGSLPRGLFSRWELRSDCGIRGAITREYRGYHEDVALQKAGCDLRRHYRAGRPLFRTRTATQAWIEPQLPLRDFLSQTGRCWKEDNGSEFHRAM